MTTNHNFELLRDEFISELKTRAKLYRHVRTGAELLSLINDDENKVFGITFRTPPKDSTGIAHILEHSVLCGSRKYPVKEPFVELLKGSLKTFLNAFTYPDKTCYPVASQNAEDFYNLVDVYLDAVFHPRITPFILQQEGWHYELEAPDSPMTYKGVVFNEMKGAYSSPEGILGELTQQSVFPNNTYGLDSGGDPKRIPDLTYEAFKEFHRKFYHPSNARIFFHGDDDPDRRLKIVDDCLREFDREEADSTISLQRSFDSPRKTERAFAAGSDSGDDASKGMITVNWLLEETKDPALNLSFQVLEYILLGMPGSPLRKALIDSGLGEDLAGVGLEAELRQMYFSTGLKGVDLKNTGRIEELILETLKELVGKGIDPHTIEAALNTIEFRLRENNAGHLPRGLALMLRSMTTWLYEGDPLALLAFEAPLSAVKSAAADPSYFQEMIRRYFLENTHRATLILKPDPELGEREKLEEQNRLEAAKRSMDAGALEKVIENTQELRRMQETPDPPEALATIPALKISDLEKTNKLIPFTPIEKDAARILYHDIFTNGIAYLDLGFNLRLLPQRFLPYIPLFGRTLVEMGTEREDFVTLGQRINRKTGGVRPRYFTSAKAESKRGEAWLLLRCKTMAPRTDELLAILRDVLLTVRLDNRDRFRQMVLEEKARREKELIPQGQQAVNLRLRAHFSEADWAAEMMGGVSYIFFLRQLAKDIEDDWTGVLSVLEDIRSRLLNRNAMILNATLDQPGWAPLESSVVDFLESLPAERSAEVEWTPESFPPSEGMIIPAKVNYVGKGANIYDLGYRFHGSIQVITGYLRTSWLWERIRVQGGAYGASGLFDRLSGVFTFVSYRDPNLMKTLENYDRTAEFLRNVNLSDEELTKAIIGAIGTVDTYFLPDARGYISMLRHLTNDSEERRQRMRSEILATTQQDFRNFADVLDELGRTGIVKVLGPADAIEEAERERAGWLATLPVL